MELNRENILEILGSITEPDLKKDIVTLNLVEGMNVPFLGHIPLVQSVCEAGDVGRPAVFQKTDLFPKHLTI